MGKTIDSKLTRHMLNEAIADMLTYYIPDWLVITAGTEAYQWMQDGGMIIDGKYDGKYDNIPVRLDKRVESDMVYVEHRAYTK